jgi:prolipoprotein diacylglyceryltransferase
MKIGTINLAGYRFLQLASSIAGLLIVFIAIISLKKTMVYNKTIDYRYWLITSVIILAVMFMRFVGGLHVSELRRVIVSFISSVMIAIILTPMILSQQEQLKRDRFAEKNS